MGMKIEKWTEGEIMERFFVVFPCLGSKIIMDPDGINALFTDP